MIPPIIGGFFIYNNAHISILCFVVLSMKILLDDISVKEDLYPLQHTRSVADIRVGILTIREKWEILSGK